MAANNPMVKGDAEREADKNKQLSRSDVEWALEACNWHRNRNRCAAKCRCNWCLEADIFRAMLNPMNASFLFKEKVNV